MPAKQLDPILNERFCQVRQELGLSQAAFAKQLGEHQSAIALIELKQRIVTGKHIRTLCETFNVNPTWLLLGEGKMFRNTDPSYAELIAELGEKYQISEPQQQILNFLLNIPEEQREAFLSSFLNLINIVKPLLDAYEAQKNNALEMPDISELPLTDRIALIKQANNLLVKERVMQVASNPDKSEQ